MSLNLRWVVQIPALLLLMFARPVGGQESQIAVPPLPTSTGGWNHSHEGPYGEALLRLEKAIRCNCGCMLDVHLCQFQMQCGTSPAWSQRLLSALEAGESDEAILAGFSTDFGASVLMALPREGFNWVGYILPWVAILVGAAGVGALFRRRTAFADTEGVEAEVTSAEWSRIQEAMDQLREEEEGSGF